MKHLFITGVNRSGHSTLVKLLNTDPQIEILDERPYVLPWHWKYSNRAEEFKKDFFDYFKVKMAKSYGGHKFIGGAACYYLKAIPFIKEILPEARIAIIKRNRNEVIQAFADKLNIDEKHTEAIITSKFLSRLDPNASNWEIAYPKYQSIEGVEKMDLFRELVGSYWDEFYGAAYRYADEYKDVKIYNSKELIKGNNYKKLVE